MRSLDPRKIPIRLAMLAVPPAVTGTDEERRTLETALAMLGQLQPTAAVTAIGAGELAPRAMTGFDVAAARDRVNPALALLRRMLTCPAYVP